MRSPIISSSGFRCIPEFPADLNFFKRVGKNLAIDQPEPLAICSDTRPSGKQLVDALIAGISSAGSGCVSLGVRPTPVMSFACSEGFYKTGVTVTSSHNPPEWNGLKIFDEDGVIVSEEALRTILEDEHASLSIARARIDRARSITPKDFEVVDAYDRSLLNYLSQYGGTAGGLRIVVDVGNGSASVTVPPLLRAIGANVTTINEEMDGLFRRQIEPRPEALTSLCQAVKTRGADFGVAFDCDGDRAVLVDERGSVLNEDLTLALAFDFLLKKIRGPVVVNVATSLVIDSVCEMHGARVFRSAVGERNVIKEMLRIGSRIGGEGSCGGLIALDHAPVRDGCLSCALVACLLHEARTRLSTLVSSYPIFKQRRLTVPIDPRIADTLISKIEQWRNLPESDRLDGLRFSGPDWWVLIRPSRTEPLIRVMVEGRRDDQVDDLMKRYSAIVQRVLSELSPRASDI